LTITRQTSAPLPMQRLLSAWPVHLSRYTAYKPHTSRYSASTPARW